MKHSKTEAGTVVTLRFPPPLDASVRTSQNNGPPPSVGRKGGENTGSKQEHEHAEKNR